MVAPARGPDPNSIVIGDVTHGLYLNVPAYKVPPGGLVEGSVNMRIFEGRLTSDQMGSRNFPVPSNPIDLNGPVTLIDTHVTSTGSRTLILGTSTDLYLYDENAAPDPRVKYITPRYNVGTASVTSGTTTVTDASATALWLSNVKPGDFISFGSATEVELMAGWQEIASVTDDVTLELVGNSPTTEVAVPYTIRKLFTGDTFNLWSSEMFLNAQPSGLDTWYATRGLSGDNQTNEGGFVKWDGTSDTVELVDLGFSAKRIIQHKRMMLYGDIEEAGDLRPQNQRNSDIEFPEVADGDTGLSRELRISNSTDTLQRYQKIGDNVAAYFSRSVNLLQFTGEPFVFLIRVVLPNFGLVSPGLLQDRGNFHEFISRDRAYEFNGASFREIGPQVFRNLLQSLDVQRLPIAVSHSVDLFGESSWNIPLRTDDPGVASIGPRLSAEFAHTTHYREQVADRPVPITKRNLPATAYGQYINAAVTTWDDVAGIGWNERTVPWNSREGSENSPIELWGDANGFVYQMNVGGPIRNTVAAFGRAPVWDGNYKGILRRLYSFLQRRNGASYTIKATLRFFNDRDTTTGDETGSAQVDVPLDGSRRVEWHAFRNAGRYMDLTYEHDGENEPWAVDSFEAQTTKAGLT